jgi:hypothetical protein
MYNKGFLAFLMLYGAYSLTARNSYVAPLLEGSRFPCTCFEVFLGIE